MHKNTAVITGGAGFIGSHLSERLLADGFKVVCVDNLITGERKNIRQHLKNSRFDFLEHDISKHVRIPGPVDYVLHFASPASPDDYLSYPIQTLKVGSLGSHNALGLAKDKKAVFLAASTSEVYGDPLVHPQPESYWGNVNPIGIRSCYDEAKRFTEAITMAYQRVYKMDTRIVRIFNTYGPRMRLLDGRVVPNFITQVLTHKPLTIYGDGSQTRSFCYVSDLVEGIVRLMRVRFPQPVNLGNPGEFTIRQLANLVIKLAAALPEAGRLGRKSSPGARKIVFKPLPQDDPKQRKPDISRARKILNWAPVVDLNSGLQKTIPWFREKIIDTK